VPRRNKWLSLRYLTTITQCYGSTTLRLYNLCVTHFHSLTRSNRGFVPVRVVPPKTTHPQTGPRATKLTALAIFAPHGEWRLIIASVSC
jgi:hypothetical protein